jgi:hypothetical protein
MTDEGIIAKAMVIAAAVWESEPPPLSLVNEQDAIPLALYMALKHQQSLPDDERNWTEEEAMRRLLYEKLPAHWRANSEFMALLEPRLH